MALSDLTDWLNEMLGKSSVWYLKRLSGNDTLANQAHQAGPYIPKELLFEVLPALNRVADANPDVEITASIDSHSDARSVRAVWYNNRLRGGSRNEARITNWGGSASALLNPENTGALAIFVFIHSDRSPQRLHVWVCRSVLEEDLAEERVSPVEPGRHVIWRPASRENDRILQISGAEPGACRLSRSQLPPEWLVTFPSGAEIVRRACAMRPATEVVSDERLLIRRACEFELFKSVEEAIEGDQIKRGFNSISDFLVHAQRILQRRKSRSGRSLELQTFQILVENGLKEGRDFSHGPESEPGKTPDFIFPSELAYKDSRFPATRLRLLAAKTTCKDRWRQVINEADRIPVKHLLTLQEGVSESQFTEMKDAGIRLVVPTPLVQKYPHSVRPELISLEQFISSTRALAHSR